MKLSARMVRRNKIQALRRRQTSLVARSLKVIQGPLRHLLSTQKSTLAKSVGTRILKIRLAGAVVSRIAVAQLMGGRLLIKAPRRQLEEIENSIIETMRAVSKQPDTAFSPKSARSLAETLAVCIHAILADAYRIGHSAGKKHNVPVGALSKEWRTYDSFLLASKYSAKTANVVAMVEVLQKSVEHAMTGVRRLCALASAEVEQSTGPQIGSFEVGVSALSRRYAMLAAALVVLSRQLLDKRAIFTVSQAVDRSKLLRRHFERTVPVARLSKGYRVLQQVGVMGTVTDIKWHELPSRPFSDAELSGSQIRLRVPFKSLIRQGVAEKTPVLAWGRLEKDSRSGQAFVKVESEGPGKYKQQVWEDFLATVAAPSYSLYPGYLNMEWAFASKPSSAAILDLLARLPSAPRKRRKKTWSNKSKKHAHR